MRSAMLSLAAMFAVAFVLEWTGAFATVSRPLGKVEVLDGFVRRLPHAEMSWDWVVRSALVEAEDAVITARQAHALIRLNDLTEVEVGPNSLVVIGSGVEGAELKFLSGGHLAKLRKGSPSVLRNTRASPNWVPIDHTKVGNLNDAFINNGIYDLKFTAPELAKVLDPVPEYQWDLSKNSLLTLSWSPIGNATYEVTLKDLNHGGTSRVLASVNPAVELRSLERGVYEWSVRGVDSQGIHGPASEPRVFKVIGAKPIAPQTISRLKAPPKILPVRIRSGGDSGR